MFICENVLSQEELKNLHLDLKELEWNEGHTESTKAHKDNKEIVHKEIGQYLANSIMNHETVRNKCFIEQMTLPMINRYENSGKYNRHIDSFKQANIRTDWSFTLFLTEPDTYEGGELFVEDVGPAPMPFKLKAGSVVLYPSGNPHWVTPVTKGSRIAAVGWAQSTIEDPRHRKILEKLVGLMRHLESDKEANKDKLVDCSYMYNNLLKLWS